MTFAQSLKRARLKAGLTPVTAAPVLGVTFRTVYMWEAGKPVPCIAAQKGALLLLKEREKKLAAKKK